MKGKEPAVMSFPISEGPPCRTGVGACSGLVEEELRSVTRDERNDILHPRARAGTIQF